MKKVWVHISDVAAGDVIDHRGNVVTVGAKDIRRCPFMGVSIFGDSYNCGHKPVMRVEFPLLLVAGRTVE
jgi:hypothetical protein